MSDPFAVFQNGTITLIRCNGQADAAGGPVAGYLSDDGTPVDANVIAAGVPAQIEYHRPREFGHELLAYDQPVNRSARDIWIAGAYPEVGETGNGVGVLFTSTNRGTGFGRITDVEFDDELAGMPGGIMLVVEIMGVGGEG